MTAPETQSRTATFPTLLSVLSELPLPGWPAARLWLGEIVQVKRDSGASLTRFDRTAGGSEFDKLIEREPRGSSTSLWKQEIRLKRCFICFIMQPR
ncbi:hypothetical protein EYF80_045047 [Liparis tanakae]|uniref:Uncharacterized protein n=1 Tax=Liparis tanakae TaxID=230148 RepID=A0A4Z2FTZ6_9TELE|nr:hypothetical protein EYF80_045047 [Liparis tanakae]